MNKKHYPLAGSPTPADLEISWRELGNLPDHVLIARSRQFRYQRNVVEYDAGYSTHDQEFITIWFADWKEENPTKLHVDTRQSTWREAYVAGVKALVSRWWLSQSAYFLSGPG